MKKINPSTIKQIIILFLIILLFIAVYFAISLAPNNYLKISFLNVGQGDAILFQTPRGAKILVDGGRDKTVLTRLGLELPVFTKTIDLIIATHDDLDHIYGLIDVIKKYEVKVLLYSLPNSTSNISQELIKIATEKNVKIVHIKNPMIINTSDNLIIKILFPVSDLDQNGTNENGNDASIVSQFIFGENEILLTGDLSQAGEIFLKNKYPKFIQSDVLKLGHHGSDTSTAPEFLQTVKPELAIISSGKNNSFGHPHKSVINLLEKFQIKYLNTAEIGTITLYSNGINIWQE